MSQRGKIAALAWMLCLTFCASAAAAAQLLPTSTYAQLDRPPARETPALTADEVAKLKKDLAGARDRQNSHLKSKDGVPSPKPKNQ
jgi:hypothetical protein